MANIRVRRITGKSEKKRQRQGTREKNGKGGNTEKEIKKSNKNFIH